MLLKDICICQTWKLREELAQTASQVCREFRCQPPFARQVRLQTQDAPIGVSPLGVELLTSAADGKCVMARILGQVVPILSCRSMSDL